MASSESRPAQSEPRYVVTTTGINGTPPSRYFVRDRQTGKQVGPYTSSLNRASVRAGRLNRDNHG